MLAGWDCYRSILQFWRPKLLWSMRPRSTRVILHALCLETWGGGPVLTAVRGERKLVTNLAVGGP